MSFADSDITVPVIRAILMSFAGSDIAAPEIGIIIIHIVSQT